MIEKGFDLVGLEVVGLNVDTAPFYNAKRGQFMSAKTGTSFRLSTIIVSVLSIFSFVFLYTFQCESDTLKTPLSSNGNSYSRLENDDLIRMTQLLTVVHRFKEIALVDYEEALALYADQRTISKFKTIDDQVWLATSPRIGWSFFVSVSIHAVGITKNKQPLVAFYNPFSDIFLITLWRMDETIPRMTDAEILLADWIRADTTVLSPVPFWLRTEIFKPAALGNSVAESITAFEQLFSIESDEYWRKKLLILEDQQLLTDVNYPAIGIMLYNSMTNIDNFRTAVKNDNPRMASCREATIAALHSAGQGKINELLIGADETSFEIQTILRKLDPEWFRTLDATAAFTGSDGCLVFLSPVINSSGSLSLFFKGEGDEFTLKRIDVVSYTGFYNKLNKIGIVDKEEVLQ